MKILKPDDIGDYEIIEKFGLPYLLKIKNPDDGRHENYHLARSYLPAEVARGEHLEDGLDNHQYIMTELNSRFSGGIQIWKKVF